MSFALDPTKVDSLLQQVFRSRSKESKPGRSHGLMPPHLKSRHRILRGQAGLLPRLPHCLAARSCGRRSRPDLGRNNHQPRILSLQRIDVPIDPTYGFHALPKDSCAAIDYLPLGRLCSLP